MNLESLTQRLAEIASQMEQNRTLASQHASAVDQLNAQQNALIGAHQETSTWLEKLRSVVEAVDSVASLAGLAPVSAAAHIVEAGLDLVGESKNV